MTVPVTVRLEDQNSQPYANAIITAILDRTVFDVFAQAYIFPVQQTFRTDEFGDAVLNLWPNENGGSVESSYRIVAQTVSGVILLDLKTVVPNLPNPPYSVLSDISEEVTCGACSVDNGQGGDVSEHEAKANPHPQYATGGAEDNHSGRTDNPHSVSLIQIGAEPEGAADNAISDHESAANPHPQYATGGAQDSHSGQTNNPHGVTFSDVGADPAGSGAAARVYSDDALAAHASLDSNPHGVTAAQVGADPVGSAASALSAAQAADLAHLNAVNPHAITPATIGADSAGSAAAAQSGAEATATAADAAHVAAPDPHTQYLKKAVDWFLVDDDISLDGTHIGKTADITTASVISLPTLAAASAGFAVELIPASSPLAITLAAAGADPIKDDLSVITGPAVVCRNRAGTSWIVLGEAEAP